MILENGQKITANVKRANGYERRDAIRDWALGEFQRVYKDNTIGKEDIFYYIYGLFHSNEYKTRYADNLSKMLPRIPYCKDFWGFSHAGRNLAGIHLNYESENLNKSAIEWIMERYQIKTDKDSGILNDPNTFSDNPRYILDLLLRIIEVSVRSVEIINHLPKMKILGES